VARKLIFLLALGALGCEQPVNAAGPGAAQAAPAADADVADPVATIGDTKITLAELDEAAAAGIMKAKQQIFEARNQALQQLIGEKLLDDAALAKGVTKEAMLKAEVEDKIDPVLDAEVDAFYAQNQARMNGPIEQLRPQILGYLENQRKTAAMTTLMTGLKNAANVTILLAPPRIQVDPGDSPRYGNAEAAIEIIEFSDFQCPYCIRGASTLEEVKEKYGDQITVVFRHFPLSFHQNAHKAAQASECANEQGKFWEYHDMLFANQAALTEPDLVRYATDLEADMTAFNECLTSGRHAATVDQDMKEGEVAGMTGTPGFFINGRFLNGAQPIEAFVEIIDAELARGAG
jgi:protein-disulfide isomerase